MKRMASVLIIILWHVPQAAFGRPGFSAPVPELIHAVRPAPFLSGERLVYDISWSGLNVGEGVQEISPGHRFGDRDVLRAVSTAASNDFISFFFKVRDRIESLIDAEGLYSHRIVINQRHGGRKRHKEIHFDQAAHTARMVYKGATTDFEIPPNVQDALSSLYYFRALPELPTTGSVFIDVHESKKNWRLEIQILGREMLKTVLGKVPVIKVKAVVLFEGVLMDQGDVYIWFTDDDRRIPVLMSGRIAIGSITATLSRFEPARIVPAPPAAPPTTSIPPSR